MVDYILNARNQDNLYLVGTFTLLGWKISTYGDIYISDKNYENLSSLKNKKGNKFSTTRRIAA
jgi:hypothetical protein